jgi:hypothetical protein
MKPPPLPKVTRPLFPWNVRSHLLPM